METEQNTLHAGATESTFKRIISVQASGEVCCPPDVIKFSICVHSSKESLEAAQLSVKRRTEYIVNVLHNNKFKDKDIKCSTDITKGEEVIVQSDVFVEGDSLSKCENVRNLLIEKLDSSVQFSPITFHHTPEIKETKRQEAFKKAVSNAKSKAQCITQTVAVQLGSAIEVTEDSQHTSLGSDSGADMGELEPDSNKSSVDHHTSLHQRYESAVLRYRSQVSATFEVQPLRSCSHKKCKKHT